MTDLHEGPGRAGEHSVGEASDAGGATLERLVSDLGAGIVEVLAAPRGLDVRLSHVIIADPISDPETERGDVVLAVGMRPQDPTTSELIRTAGNMGAAAVAIKADGDVPKRLRDIADEAGVVLLAVAPQITWGQLYSLMRTTVASAGQVMEGPAAVGTPVGDLFALANAVAGMVGGPTTIEDPQSRVLAYSSLEGPIDEARRRTILGRRVPKAWIRRLNDAGIFQQLWSSHDVVRVDQLEDPEGHELRARLAIAVRAGDEILGSIWVSEGDSPLDDDSERALRQAAEIAALHLVRHRVGEDLERRARGDLLRSLLNGRGPLNALADRLGLEAEGHFAIVAFELRSSEEAETALQRERALQLVSMYCEAFRRRIAQVPIGSVIYTLLPVNDPGADDGVLRLAHDILDRSGDVLSVQMLVGISQIVHHLREVPRAREEVDQILRILADDPDGPHLATFDEVRAQALLLELRDFAEQRPHVRHGKVELLEQADDDGAGIYLDTLRTYLDHFGDIPAAARELNIHPNTFRYRLRRLPEIADLDLSDPVERFAAEVQLRLR